MLTGSSTTSDQRPEPEVRLLTADDALAKRMAVALASRRIEARVGSTAEDARRMLLFDARGVRIIDAAARRILPSSVSETMRMLGLEDDLVMIIGTPRDEQHQREDFTAACFVYPRHAIEQLVRHLADWFRDGSVPRDAVEQILGGSSAIGLVREQIRSVARYADVPVLVLGETGTGKELVARALHESTFGTDKPFVAINCAAIPETLFESELFGHEAGAYTGARGVRVGLFEAAAGGTVFLDEVGEMPAPMQPKLLRVLESREFRRVGSNRNLPLQARIISATNRNPWLSSCQALRPDLLYRLAGFTLRLPPLRERTGDIPILARHFVAAFRERYGTPQLRLSSEAVELLEAHQWPGNIRELRVVTEHACIVSRGAAITAADVRAALGVHRQSAGENAVVRTAPREAELPPSRKLRDLEREIILNALDANEGNISRTAKQLGIPRSTLRAKLKRIRA
jgi:two-component system, NtrC family, response regulator AtoC